MKKYVLIIAIIAGFIFSANAQQFRIGANYGFLGYYGDLSYETVQMQYILPGWGINIERLGDNGVNFRLNRTVGSFSYNDRTIDRNGDIVNNPNFDRSLNFKTDVEDISLNVIFNLPNKSGKNRKFNPYAGIGIGSTNFTVFGDLLSVNESRYYYWEDGTIRDEAQTNYNAAAQIIAQDGVYETNLSVLKTNTENYKHSAYNIPVTVGFDINLNKNWSLNLETSLKMTNTDYLDDASGLFPDINAEDNSFLAYASQPNKNIEVLRARGNEVEENDWFYYSSVGLNYSFGTKSVKQYTSKKDKRTNKVVNKIRKNAQVNMPNTNYTGGLFGNIKEWEVERKRLRALRLNKTGYQTNNGDILINEGEITTEDGKSKTLNINNNITDATDNWNTERKRLRDIRKNKTSVKTEGGNILNNNVIDATDNWNAERKRLKDIRKNKTGVKTEDGNILIREGEVTTDDGKSKLLSTKAIENNIKEKMLKNAEKMEERTNTSLLKPVEVEIRKPKMDRIREALEGEGKKVVKIIKEIVKPDGTVEIVEEEVVMKGNKKLNWLEQKLQQFGETATEIIVQNKNKVDVSEQIEVTVNRIETPQPIIRTYEPNTTTTWPTETNTTWIENTDVVENYDTYNNYNFVRSYNAENLPRQTVAVFFGIGKTAVAGEFKTQIDEVIVPNLKDNQALNILLRGHADAATGGSKRNLELATLRAENVKAYILDKMGENFDTNRLTMEVHGTSETLNINPDQNNRLVEMLWYY